MVKNPLKLIKKYFGELMLIIGSGIFVYNVFNFDSSVETYCHAQNRICKGSIFGGVSSEIEAVGVSYYYSPNALLWFTISAMLIVIGILIIRSKKKN